MATKFIYGDPGQDESNIIGGRLSGEILTAIPTLSGYALSAQRDAALLELLAAGVLDGTQDINGATIDGSIIGGTTPAAGTFTTMTATSLVGPLTGNADSATTLATARNIGGVSFNGSAAIVPKTIQVVDSTDASSFIAMFDSATGSIQPKTDGGLTYNATTGTLTATAFSGPLTGNVTGDCTGSSGSSTGNAATATALANARDINGVSFDGTANITVTADANTLTNTTLKSTVVTSSLTAIGTLATGAVPASLVTAGTFGAGDFTFQNELVVSGTGPHAIGGAAKNYARLNLLGSFTSGGADSVAQLFDINGQLTGFAGDTTYLTQAVIQGSVVTQTATETIASISTLRLEEPGITDNLTGDITLAATLIIAAAPTEGETNAALYVSSGATMIPCANTVAGTGLMVTTNDASVQEIMRDSSSARFKENIEDAVIDVRAVLAINTKRYNRLEADGSYLGFIVEDFDAAGFSEIVAYDAEGPAGFLEFGRGITALHHAVLQSHDARIGLLEAEVEQPRVG